MGYVLNPGRNPSRGRGYAALPISFDNCCDCCLFEEKWMDSEFLAQKMRILPSIRLLYPVPISSHLLFPNKQQIVYRPLLLSIRFRSSSVAALEAEEYTRPLIDLNAGDVKTKPNELHGSCLCNSKGSSNLLNINLDSNPKRRIGWSRHKLGNAEIAKVNGEMSLKWYSEKLRNCALNLCLNEGMAIHGRIIKNGIDLDAHLWVSLINFYAKCGCLNVARLVLVQMPERDVVSWTALIAGCLSQGCGCDGVRLFREMRSEDIRSNEFTLATVLKACSMCFDLEFGKQVHAEVIKNGVFEDVYVGSAIVDLHAKCGEMKYAEKVFFSMPEQNVVSWNVLLNGYTKVGNEEELLRLFRRMTESEIKFSSFTLSTVLKGCANSKNARAGQALHSLALKIGCDHDEFISCSLVDVYSNSGFADDALKIFRGIRNPDVVLWSAIISCLDQHGRKQEAAEQFQSMRQMGVQPNQYTLTSLVNAASELGDQYYCGSIHACIYKYGYQDESILGNALITMYMKAGSVHDGHRVYNAMSDIDVISWNALLSGYHDDETCDQGLRIFSQMLVEGFKPNLYTYVGILRSCANLSDVDFGRQVHAHILKDCLDDNNYVGTALLDMYAKNERLEEVEVIFNRLEAKDIFTWTVIMAGYVQTGQSEKAIFFFNQMQKDGVRPNEFTLASCLRGCSRIASLRSGRLLHSLTIKTGHFFDVFVSTALVDMYGKCGCMEYAESVFNEMDCHDIVMWNTIICGYSQHGQGEKAFEAFKSMLDDGALPDGVTFLAILSACSHMGLIEEGKRHFHSMSSMYGISPSIEHFACMIDILGRGGKFDEAENFIEQMRLTPNALIWETLLGACKIHGNLEVGERAADILFEIEPDRDSSYILLSNMFAAKGRWDDVSKVRALMSSRGVKKEPGCSWVEVDAEMHVFLSQDASHPRISEICGKLEELSWKVASIGYIPNTDHVLHNLNDKEKRQNLFYHSERLALAFSLLSNMPDKTIRIFKNLRICGDCHEFMKHASSITNREIVIRDVKRFHSFHRGKCSCQDYW